jgi:anti-sigma regulatory factor (Ser/Thr protein kinase)
LHIGPILALIRQLVQQLGFCEARAQDIELIIDEICSNAIEHGSETTASGIELVLIFDSTHLEIVVRDKGKKMQANWLTPEKLDEIYREMSPNGERGHGIYIAKKLSDHFDIQPNSLGGTDVRLVFYRPNLS